MSTIKKILLAFGAFFILSFFLLMVIAVVVKANRTPEQVAADKARTERMAKQEYDDAQEKIAVKLRAETEEKKKQEEKSIEARFLSNLCYYAEKSVEAGLKSPSTAEFSNCYENEFRADINTGTYYVIGHVDAQNSFGAMLRSRYIVRIHTSDKKNFTIEKAVVE